MSLQCSMLQDIRTQCGNELILSKHACNRNLFSRQKYNRMLSRATSSDSLYTRGQPSETRQRLFGDIAPAYDELNDRLSFGLHKVWKRMAVQWANVRPGDRCLDLCCGSGDLAFLLAKATGNTGRVVAIDFAEEMLEYAQRRPESKQSWNAGRIDWIEGDAMDLKFSNDCFDAATIGYGLRNVEDIPTVLKELNRVLKPDCFASILDFNNASTTNQAADFLQGFALDNFVVPAARTYGLEEEYRYLRPSIQAFPTGDILTTGKEQEELAREAGFRSATHYEIAFGLMGVLVVQA